MAASGTRSEPPLIVITGPTASGKTALAIELAEKFGGEIICADSRTLYKGLNIGTAKPTAAEQARVPHWGIDLIEPNERYSAADFQRYATAKISDIRVRGKTPFLVGGTGLYIDSVIFEFNFAAQADEKQRSVLETLTTVQLLYYCRKHSVMLPKNPKNRRHLIRAIESHGAEISRRLTPRNTTYVVGIATENITLRKRITKRAEQMFDDTIVEEANQLGKKYGWSSEALTANIYPLLRQLAQGVYTREETKQRFITRDTQLAKRQMTWLRRNPFVEWCTLDDAAVYIGGQLLADE